MGPKVAVWRWDKEEAEWLNGYASRGELRLYGPQDNVADLVKAANVTCFVVAQVMIGGSGYVKDFGHFAGNPLGDGKPVLVDRAATENFLLKDAMPDFPRYLACLGFYAESVSWEDRWTQLMNHLAQEGIGLEDWAMYIPHLLFMSEDRDELMAAFLKAWAHCSE